MRLIDLLGSEIMLPVYLPPRRAAGTLSLLAAIV
jgi:hypothetical protein